MAADMLIQ